MRGAPWCFTVEPTAMYQQGNRQPAVLLYYVVVGSYVLCTCLAPLAPGRYGASVLLVWLNAEVGICNMYPNFYILGSLLVLITYGTKYSTRRGERGARPSLCSRFVVQEQIHSSAATLLGLSFQWE